jgi:hypothetical protein
MKRTIAALILSTALAAPLAAQNATISGTVAEAFGAQVVLTTPEGRLLVTLPEGTAIPAPGTRLELTGTRTGNTFAAASVTAGAVVDPADALLPAPLRGLGLSEVRTRRADKGETYFYARSATGWLRAEARGDRLLKVQSDGAGLPPAVVAAVLPASVRGEPRLAEASRITEINLDRHHRPGEIEVKGFTADGTRIEIAFARDGSLRGYKRARDDRRSLSEQAARDRLAAAGYAQVGIVHRSGKHVTAVAVNPYGETVEVRLDDQGRISRERLVQN